MVLTLYADGGFDVQGIPGMVTDAYGMLMLAVEVIHEKRRKQHEARANLIIPRGPHPALGGD
jgi:hypothetical protein